MALYEQKSDPITGSPVTKTESHSLRVSWPASWGITMLAVWLVITGLVILLSPANAVLITLNAIVAIAAGILLFIGK
jgi:hypothetical protein